MATITEMVTEILSAHASRVSLSKKELFEELDALYGTLTSINREDLAKAAETKKSVDEEKPISVRKAFGQEHITCMLCGKKMKTLARHLKAAHHMSPREYRKEFDIPATQPLAAKEYSARRRQMAEGQHLAENLVKARKKMAAKRRAAKKGAPKSRARKPKA